MTSKVNIRKAIADDLNAIGDLWQQNLYGIGPREVIEF